MSFSDLPIELIYLIAKYLEYEVDITNALARTTRSLYILLNNNLCQHNIEHYDA